MNKTLKVGIVIGASLGPGMGRAFRTAEQKAAHLGKALGRMRLAKTAAGDVVKYGMILERLKGKQAELGVSTEAQTRRIAQTEQRFKAAKAAARRYGIRIGDVTRAQRLLSVQIKQTERNMARLDRRQRNKAVRGELKGQAMGMLGAAYAISRPFKKAMDVEQSEIRLRTVLNTKNVEENLTKARKFARNFAGKKLGSETEVLDVQYALNSAGLNAEAARLGSEVVLKVGKITGGVSEQVGEVMATTFNNLGGSLKGNVQDRLARIGELLTKTQFKFQIRDFGQLGESLKHGAPALSQYNIALDQGVTLLGALNSAGLQGSMAGTSLAATLRKMSKATEEFGFDLEYTKDNQLDVIASLQSMSDALGGLDDIDQETNDALQNIFGEEGVRGVVLLGKQLDKLRAVQDDVRESSKGIIETNYSHFLKSSAGQVQILGQNMALLGTAITSTLLPSLNSIVGPLAKGANWLGRAAEKHPLLTKVIGGTVIGLTALKLASIGTKFALTFLSDGLTVASSLFDFFRPSLLKVRWELFRLGTTAVITAAKTKALAIGGALKSFGATMLSLAGRAIPTVIAAFKAMGTAVLANPIGITIAAVALAAGLIYYHWDKIGPYFKKLWMGIKGFFKSGHDYVKGILGKIASPIKAVKKAIGGAWEMFAGKKKAEMSVTRKVKSVATPMRRLVQSAALGVAIVATPAPVLARKAPQLGVVRPQSGQSADSVAERTNYGRASRIININVGDIVINAAPGMDTRAIAEEVKRVLEDLRHQGEVERRSQLHD